MERRRGARERTVLDDGHEALEIPQVEHGHASFPAAVGDSRGDRYHAAQLGHAVQVWRRLNSLWPAVGPSRSTAESFGTMAINERLSNSVSAPDVHHTGPGTIAGRYLRSYWQPVYHSDELPAGRAKPVKIMNVDYALYRSPDGTPNIVDALCPHRGARMSVGLVEDDCIRCFYHGWKFDGAGNCLEQPAEPAKLCAQGSRRSAHIRAATISA